MTEVSTMHRRRVGMIAVVAVLVLVSCQPGTPDPAVNGGARQTLTTEQVNQERFLLPAAGGATFVFSTALNEARVTKVGPTGQPDPTWGNNGVAILPPLDSPGCFMSCFGGGRPSPMLMPDGSLIVVRNARRSIWFNDAFEIIGSASRLLPSGQLDPAYGTAGTLTILDPTSFLGHPIFDGDAGMSTHLLPSGAVVALTAADGATDVQAFSSVGQSAARFSVPVEMGGNSRTVAMDGNGRIVIVHGHTAWRIGTDRQLDPSFGTGGTVDLSVSVGPGGQPTWGTAGTPLPLRYAQMGLDGQLTVVYGDATNHAIGRRAADGSPLASFGSGGLLVPTWPEGGAAPITDIELVSNKILLASPGGLLRYTVSGTLDPSFGTGGASMRAEIAAIDAAAPSGSTSETKLTSLWANPSGIIVRGTTAVITPAYSVPSYAVTDWRWRLRA